MASSVGAITNRFRKSARPTSTWLGGAVGVPMAWRSKDNTMMMRVKPVIISNSAGRKVSAVRNSSVWIGSE